ncbi:AGZA family xanthine/uracil permease-like MFS transporter [Bacillus oleivorans]|uniref:AGZA family xanthine/uracil permease-like MFS transporter n=1 Tax=Bacillus oleivorans TaxID=1448271 RepID=A0A285CQP2_9BACI|nr:guanine permease [Bacillus oleivorans]SNX69388.1 AGZA family xanthine/uracil permease-like MFS transporter [Bacillus oleivorans]
MEDILKDILAAFSVVLNGLPQGLLALSFGFASVPTALAFMVGAVGNSLTSNVAVISFQAETIAVAGTMGKNMRDRLSSIFFGALILVIISLFGVMEQIVEWIGPVITNGMMAGVGFMLAKIAWDMAKNDRIIGVTSFASALLTYVITKDLVYTITISVILSSVVYNFIKKENETVSKNISEDKFKLQKFVINAAVIRGALALVCLNIGANIAFGKINGEIAGEEVNIDTLTIISSLADMASSLFGGGPVEVIISATASAPHAVWAGVLTMAIMAGILLFKLLPKIGKYVPSSSIAGFLFVLGAIVTLSGNATAALTAAEPGSQIVAAVTIIITAIVDPFFGLLAGVMMEFLLGIFGV